MINQADLDRFLTKEKSDKLQNKLKDAERSLNDLKKAIIEVYEKNEYFTGNDYNLMQIEKVIKIISLLQRR